MVLNILQFLFFISSSPLTDLFMVQLFQSCKQQFCKSLPVNLIKDQFLNRADGFYLERGTPAVLRIVARFLPPKSVSKKKQKQMLEGEILPLKKPDMDNIVKVVADALNGVAYHDDTQIVLVSAKKAYSAVEGLDITVEEYTDGR